MSVVITRSGWLGRITLAQLVAAQTRRPETSAIGVGLLAIIRSSRRLSVSEQSISSKENSGENVIRNGSLSLRARYEDIPLGSRLEVRCGSIPTHVQTVCGPSTDAVKFFIRFFPRKKDTSGYNVDDMFKAFTVRHGRRACDEEKGREVVWLEMPSLRDTPAPASLRRNWKGFAAKLVVVVPRWYFGVSIDSGGGDVGLGEIKHASKAEVWSRGGEISSESTIQAVHVKLITEGGSIKARRVVAQDVLISTEGPKTSIFTKNDEWHASGRQDPRDMRAKIESHCGIDIQSIAGMSVKMEARHGKVRLGSCHVDAGGSISCGGFEAATFRGPLNGFNVEPCASGTGALLQPLLSSVHQDCILTLDRGGSAVIGGLDGCLCVRGEGAATVDVQVNDGCRRLVVEMEEGENENLKTLMMGISPTLGAVVTVKGPANSCILPQDAVLTQQRRSNSTCTPSTSLSVGEELSVRLQPRTQGHTGYTEDRYEDKPVSRLERSRNVVGMADEDAGSWGGKPSEARNDEVNMLGLESATLPCSIVVKACGDVAIRRRSWIAARMAGLRSRRQGR